MPFVVHITKMVHLAMSTWSSSGKESQVVSFQSGVRVCSPMFHVPMGVKDLNSCFGLYSILQMGLRVSLELVTVLVHYKGRFILKGPDRAKQESLFAHHISSSWQSSPDIHQDSCSGSCAQVQEQFTQMWIAGMTGHHALNGAHVAEVDKFSRLLCSSSCIPPGLFPLTSTSTKIHAYSSCTTHQC